MPIADRDALEIAAMEELEGGDKPITHYLVTMVCEGEPVPGDKVAERLSYAIRALDLEPKMAACYTYRIAIDPTRVGLKDAWMGLSGSLRHDIAMNSPALATAIALIIGMES